jgi:hypothetical protein
MREYNIAFAIINADIKEIIMNELFYNEWMTNYCEVIIEANNAVDDDKDDVDNYTLKSGRYRREW